MNDKKLNQLFAATRRETPPTVPADFADRIQRVLGQTEQAEPVAITFIDQLNHGFTRYAVAAAAMIMVCAAIEINQSLGHEPSIDDDVSQICSDWMLH